MLEDFPHIEIVPLDKVVRHEWHDDQRATPLIDALRASGVLRNPPILAPFNDGTGRYMVLDGANRTTALSQMGFPHIVAQLIEPDSPHLDLRTWNHVIWDMATEDLIAAIQQIPDVNLNTIETEAFNRPGWDQPTLGYFQTPADETYHLTTPHQDLAQRIDLLNSIVNKYKQQARLDRTKVRKAAEFKAIHPNLTGVFIFPPAQVNEVIHLCGQGHLYPAGVTRFTVAPRALRLNYPLDDLATDRPLAEKNRSLQQWIQERIARKGVRFYAEPTVLFDE